MIRVLAPGLFTTVQDLGRWGYQHQGVPVAGPMDLVSHCRANRAVGNERGAATLEITLGGPRLRFERAARFALCGADCPMSLDGVPLAAGRTHDAPAGAELTIGRAAAGTRAYLAVAGGIDVPPLLGSRSTHVPSRMGGLDGRPLAAGDVLPIGRAVAGPPVETPAPPLPQGGAALRVLEGPEAGQLDPEAWQTLVGSRFELHRDSNRMGYRLVGPVVAAPEAPGFSTATTMGTVQLPAGGSPILLMADRPTTGGYPRVAHVITADLPIAGQLKPGDWVSFVPCTPEDARRALDALAELL